MILDRHPIVDAALRLGLAFLLALPLGWEHRSSSVRPTYPLLSACVCSFLLLARSASWGASGEADVFYGVLTGIGFVGSGLGVKSRENPGGVSMAVSLWVTGAVGAGVAYGIPLVSMAL